MICNKCNKDLKESNFEIRDWKWTRRKTCKICRNYKEKKKRMNNSQCQIDARKKYKENYWSTPHWDFRKRCDIRLCVARRKFGKENIISDWTIKAKSFYELMEYQKWYCAINKELSLRDDNWNRNYVIDHILPFARWWIHSIHNIRLIHPDTDKTLNYRIQ